MLWLLSLLRLAILDSNCDLFCSSVYSLFVLFLSIFLSVVYSAYFIGGGELKHAFSLFLGGTNTVQDLYAGLSNSRSKF